MRDDRMNDRFDRVDRRGDKLQTDVAVLQTDVAVLKTDVAVLKTDVAEIKGELREVKVAVRDLDKRLTRVEILHEETDDKIQLLFEGQVATHERLDRMEARFLGEFAGIRGDIQLFVRVQTEANATCRGRFDDHETRILSLERDGRRAD